MKIAAIETRVAGVQQRNWTFVTVRTDEGVSGLGEATCEWHEKAVLAAIENASEWLLGMDATRIEQIWQHLYRRYHFRGGVVMTTVISAIDQALWDIAGKMAGLPVYRLLGGACRDYVQLYARPDAAEGTVAEQAVRAADGGYTTFKFGVDWAGGGERELTHRLVKQVRAVREAVGDRLELWVDHAGRTAPGATLRIMRELEAAGLDVIEEPVPPDSIEAFRQVRAAALEMEIATGERLFTRWHFAPLVNEGLVDIIQPDVCHCSGISELRRIAALAEMNNIHVAPHCPRGPVALAASCHAALAMPNFRVLEHCRRYPEFFDIQRDAWEIPPNGRVVVPERPGLGVELEDSFFADHPFRALACRDCRREDGSLFEG